MYVNCSRSAGLFSYLDNAVVSGVIVTDSNITAVNHSGMAYSGAIAGGSCDSVIECCENRSYIYARTANSDITEKSYAGGIVGIIFSDRTNGTNGSNCRINSCINVGNIITDANAYSNSGGIVGYAEDGFIENVLNMGYYSAKGSSKTCVGDIAGAIDLCTLTNCYFSTTSEDDKGVGLEFSTIYTDTSTAVSYETCATAEFAQLLGDRFIFYKTGQRPYLVIEK